jgi:transcriptional regulator with XRE-family HTH domain
MPKYQYPWIPEKRINVGRRVKRWRKHNRLTQKEAAKILQISVKTIQDYEQGRRGKGISQGWYGLLMKLTKITNEPKDYSEALAAKK